MKPLSIPFGAIAYLVVLLMGYMAGGYILAAALLGLRGKLYICDTVFAGVARL